MRDRGNEYREKEGRGKEKNDERRRGRNERTKEARAGEMELTFLLKLCNNLHRFPKQFLNLKSI